VRQPDGPGYKSPPDVKSFMLPGRKNYHAGRDTTHDVGTKTGSTAQKIVTRDGEAWKATFKLNGQTKTLKFVVDFRWGIFQEVWLSELAGAKSSATNAKGNESTTRAEMEAMKVRDIKARLEVKGLGTKGKKSTLVDRLLAATGG
jgi:hypothetical protein